MRDHGIDYQNRANSNKVDYDIPSLMQLKLKTPAAQNAMMELTGLKPEIAQPEQVEVKPLTKQVPFDLKTAKRARFAVNDENENIDLVSNDDESRDETLAGKKRSRKDEGVYEPLWKTLEKNFQLRTDTDKPQNV